MWGEEPHADLFDLLGSVLTGIASAPLATLPAMTLAYQLQVASLLGYRPRLDGCPGCGGAISPRRLFSAARGGLLCDACASTETGTITLSADALGGLALLLSRPVSQAGEWLALGEVRRTGEILRVVEAFLRQHFQRFQGLRSLEVLRSLPGFESVSHPGAPNGAPVQKDAPCPN